MQASENAELAVRESIVKDVGTKLSIADRAGLEKMAEQFRATSARTPSGDWKLEWFYQTFERIGQNALNRDARTAIGATLRAWIDAEPESPTPYIALGHFEYWQALSMWSQRSLASGSRQSFAPYRTALIETYDMLLGAKAIAARDPEWYVVMENIGRLIQVDLAERFQLVEEGLDHEPRYHRIYFAAVVGLLPEWGGSYRMVETFAKGAVARTRSVEGEALYARIYWSISNGEFGPDIYRETGVERDAFNRGFRDIVKAYPGSWNLNAFAMFTCAAGDAGETKRLFDQIGDDIVRPLWNNVKYLDYCRSLAATGGAPPARPAQRVSHIR